MVNQIHKKKRKIRNPSELLPNVNSLHIVKKLLLETCVKTCVILLNYGFLFFFFETVERLMCTCKSDKDAGL